MDQIILEGILLPETSFERYTCYEEPQKRQLDMISGRRVAERIGRKWKIWWAEWSYDVLDDRVYRAILPALTSVGPVVASILPSDREEMVTSTFFVDSFTRPKFLIEDQGRAVWNGISFRLREEYPHA